MGSKQGRAGHVSHVSRREFLQASALAAGGFAVMTQLAGCGGTGAARGSAVTAGSQGSAAEEERSFPGAQGEIDSTQHQLHESDADQAPAVYFIHEVSVDALTSTYEALGKSLSGSTIGVKLSTGEPGSNFLDPALIEGLVHAVNGTIVECNTAYGGSRASTESHYQVAADHGYTGIATVQIMDENGSLSLPVEGGEHLSENLVGAHFSEYDGFLVLSHFKGHAMAGFGGALKNISIGLASSEGKCLIHSAGASRTNPWGTDTAPFQESMAEAAKSVLAAVNGNMLFVNVMNRLSVDCDCDGHPAEPKMADIGILASADPVALDQACVDLIYESDDDSADLIERIESRGGEHTLEHAEKIGVGSRSYSLVEVHA